MKTLLNSSDITPPKRLANNAFHLVCEKVDRLVLKTMENETAGSARNLAAKPHLCLNALRTTHSTL